MCHCKRLCAYKGWCFILDCISIYRYTVFTSNPSFLSCSTPFSLLISLLQTHTMELPKTQRAAIKQGTGDSSTIVIKEIPVPEPSPDQILVKINYSGFCASDKSLLHDEWSFKMADCASGIAGHEGAGTVVAVGPTVSDLWQSGTALVSIGSLPSVASASSAPTAQMSAAVLSS
jgi:hypothetical protein